MKEVTIGRAALSAAVWDRILTSAELYQYERRSLFSTLSDLDRLRANADYGTGSISASTAWVLYAVARFFNPITIAEVGTYIGRSATALGYGAAMENPGVLVITCDASNDIELPQIPNGARLRQYRKTTSTEMFTDMVRRIERADLLNLDGRLTQGDLELLKNVVHDRTVILLDDFEGTEKGTVNAQVALQTLGPQYYVMVYPPTSQQLAAYGLHERCTTAMLLPRTLLKFTNQ